MKIKWMIAAALCGAGAVHAQMGRTFDWYTAGGDSQHSNWEKSDSKFTKDTVKDFKLILKRKLEGAKKNEGPLMAPVVLGNLISYRGFKELAFVTNPAGDVWAIDADLDRVFWQRHVDLPKGKAKGGCPGGVTSQPTMKPGATFGAPRRRPATGTTTAAPAEQSAAAQAAMYRRIFAPRAVYLAGNDGNLYFLDTSTGKDVKPAKPFVPAGADVSALNVNDDVIYATTNGGCGGAADAVWALPIGEESNDAKALSYEVKDGLLARGVVIGTEGGDVYAQTPGAVIALSGKELKPGATFKVEGASNSAPAVFPFKGRDLIATAGKDGSLYLIDTKMPGEAVYHTPAPLGDEIRGGLTTWESDGTRWLVAAVWGKLHSGFKAELTNGETGSGALVAFKVEEQDGKPMLTAQWISRDLSAPVTPVVANGVVFALSAGDYGKMSKPKGHATLYALDAETGKEIYSTGDQVSAPASLTGLVIANGRAYFTTTDSTLCAFGYYLEP